MLSTGNNATYHPAKMEKQGPFYYSSDTDSSIESEFSNEGQVFRPTPFGTKAEVVARHLLRANFVTLIKSDFCPHS